jgi:hypothetical protein
MTRWALSRRVFFIEESIDDDGGEGPRLAIRKEVGGVVVVEPRVPRGLGAQRRTSETKALIADLCCDEGIRAPIAWFGSAGFVDVARDLPSAIVVYDCDGAPAPLESELLSDADIVFAAEPEIYERKRRQHGNAHLVPDGVDGASWDQAFVEVRRIVDAALRAWPLQHLLDSLGV